MVLLYIEYLFIFLLGLCIGSFLNCTIYRLEQEKKITGRSFCPHCKHMLSWKDLFPIFSFLFLRGKCRYCRKKIGIQYPLVELAAGLIFLLVFMFQVSSFNFQEIMQLCFMLYVLSSMIVIFVYDLKHYLIPDKVLIPAIVVGVIYRVFEFFAFSSPIGGYLLAAIIASGFFFVIFVISRGQWIGFGDVKLAVLMGLALGMPYVLVALFLAFFFGAIIGVIMLALEKKSLKSQICFGPFLILGTFITMFWGLQLLNWYLNLFLI